MLLLWASQMGLHATLSVPVRIDWRTTTGGQIITGTQRVSPVANEADASASLAIDDKGASSWSVAEPNCDSTKLSDGWHEFQLTEKGQIFTKSLLVLNGVAVHEGKLEKDETWDASKVHVVRDLVRVKKDVTLAIAENAIVKFCDGAGVIIEEGGTLKLGSAVLTHIADGSRGGDTVRDNSKHPVNNAYTLTGLLTFDGDPEVLYYTNYTNQENHTATAEGCDLNRPSHAKGAIVTVTANLELDNAAKFYVFHWSGSLEVVFTETKIDGDTATTTFIMPGEDISIACTAELKELENNDQLSVLRLQPGWNLLTLRRPLIASDAQRFLVLRPVVLDADNKCYIRCAAPSAFQIGAGYWVFSATARVMVLEHDQSQTSWKTVGLKQGWNLIGVADGSAWQKKATDIWKWEWLWKGNPYQPVTQAELISGQAYWAKPFVISN